MQETTSKFNANASLKLTPTERYKCENKSEKQADEPNNCKLNFEGKFRFTYSKNELYQLFLSHSSQKVRPNTSYREYNGIFFKLTKVPLLSSCLEQIEFRRGRKI